MKRAPKNRSFEASTRGGVLVELALMLPLLVILFLGIVELGLIVREHQVLQNAAREGARFSALPQNKIGPTNPTANESAIKQRVIDYLAEEKITVTADKITVNQAYPVTVDIGGVTYTEFASEITVTYDRSLLTRGAAFLRFGAVQLTGRAVFRNLYGS